MTATATNHLPTFVPSAWDEEADVIVVGYGFAGSAAAIAAHDAGATVLLLEKASEQYKGGNSRVNAQILFWPNDIEKAKTYFKALAGPYMDNISEEMVEVWATSKMAERRQIRGGTVDGPLAMDDAVSPTSSRTRGVVSAVAGRADVLVVPNVEAGNILVKELTYAAQAEAAGIVLGATVPIMLTSRADDERSRVFSCVVAILYNSWLATGRSVVPTRPGPTAG